MEESFVEYLHNTRKEFEEYFTDNWLDRSVEERVIIENLLIAYDQATDQVEELLKLKV